VSTAVAEFKPQPSFFPNAKRRITLDGWTPLMNSQDEKRVRFDFDMPLTGESFLGMPGFIGGAFESMNKEDSVEKKSTLELELEGITVEFFATDKSPRRHNMLTATTLRSFYLERDGEGLVHLHFSITVRRDEDLVIWAHKYEGATMWIEFTATQPSLVAPKDEKQMKLGDKPEVDDDTTKQSKEAKKAVDEIHVPRARKEEIAKKEGKPRGFTGPVKGRVN
jgi:hypothetical protein